MAAVARRARSGRPGRLIGEQAATAAMAAGGVDPAIAQIPIGPAPRPGEWVATPLPQIEPYMSTFRPWVIPSAEALRAAAAAGAHQRRSGRATTTRCGALGGRTSTERTPHQTLMARYRQAST